MKCVSNHENQNQNDVIKIVRKTEHNLGYVYFLEDLSSEQNAMKHLTLNINFNKVQARVNSENVLTLEIDGKLSNKIEHPIEKDTLTKIEILIKENETSEKKEVNCFTDYIGKEKGNDVILKCQFNILGNEEFEINVDANGFSKNVHFNLVKNIKINIGEEEDPTNQTDNKATDNNSTDTTKKGGDNSDEKDDSEDENSDSKKNDNEKTDGEGYNHSDDHSDFIRSYKNNLRLIIFHLFLIILIH